MAWRFRRSIRILPGVKINLSQRGVSTTLGSSPFSVNIGPDGVHQTTSIPGTGLYNRQRISGGGSSGGDNYSSSTQSMSNSGCLFMGLLGIAVLFLFVAGMKSSGSGQAPAAAAPTTAPVQLLSAAAQAAPIVYARTTANCRTRPSTSAPIAAKLAGGQLTRLLSSGAKFSQVELQDGTRCHVARRLLTARLASAALVSSQPKVRHHRRRAAAYSPLKPAYAVDDGYCPCSGYRNCTGPRGGQYCYTRTGRKRYR